MDEQTTLAIMDAMAEKIEALTERVEAAEKKLQEAGTNECTCENWRTQRKCGAAGGTGHA